jgi:putative oxidoreductase
MSNTLILGLARRGYGYLTNGASSHQPLFLFAVRVYWGWQFFQTGKGKLANISNIASYFHDLGIPVPTLSAYMAGSAECFGGLFLLLGIASRLTSVPLIFTMIVAYVTAERDALQNIFTNPDKFTSADPFLVLLAAVIVFFFGAGPLSVDGLVKWLVIRRKSDESSFNKSAAAPAI